MIQTRLLTMGQSRSSGSEILSWKSRSRRAAVRALPVEDQLCSTYKSSRAYLTAFSS